MENDEFKVSPEEAAAEQEALTDAKEDDLRTTLAEELGLSVDEDGDKLDKLVAREMKNRKLLSTAIRQKIDLRTKLTGAKPAVKPGSKVPLDEAAVRAEAESAVEARLEQRDLDDMEYSDAVKSEIKKVAKLQGISVRKAANDPYIQHVVEAEKKQQAINEAADNGTRKGKSGVKVDLSKPLDPKDFNLSTEEGRKAWADAKEAKRNAGN